MEGGVPAVIWLVTIAGALMFPVGVFVGLFIVSFWMDRGR